MVPHIFKNHFTDIAATNAYILHHELCMVRGEKAMTHKVFMEEVTAQLCGTTSQGALTASADHLPLPIASSPSDPSQKDGRQ